MHLHCLSCRRVRATIPRFQQELSASTCTASPEDAGDVVDTVCCRICLEDGSDDGSKLLLRSCACRGSAGYQYAHMSCLINCAHHKSDELVAAAKEIRETSYDFADDLKRKGQKVVNVQLLSLACSRSLQVAAKTKKDNRFISS